MGGVKVAGTPVENFEDAPPPGAFRLVPSNDVPDAWGYFEYLCPCGCGSQINVPVGVNHKPKRAKGDAPTFEWDGNPLKPTIWPALRRFGDWRGFVTAGVFEPLPDPKEDDPVTTLITIQNDSASKVAEITIDNGETADQVKIGPSHTEGVFVGRSFPVLPGGVHHIELVERDALQWEIDDVAGKLGPPALMEHPRADTGTGEPKQTGDGEA